MREKFPFLTITSKCHQNRIKSVSEILNFYEISISNLILTHSNNTQTFKKISRISLINISYLSLSITIEISL